MTLGNWIGGAMRSAGRFVQRMAGETRGNVAMIFGLSLPVLILMTVGGVDIHRASTVRVNLQDALDAAALAAARSPYTLDADIQRVGMASLRANLKAYPDVVLREADTSFVLSNDEVVVAQAKVDVKAIVANIFLPPYGKFLDDYIQVGAGSEVDRATQDIEVAMVLDITGSMEGSRLTDLKTAANDLVDLVVQDNQIINSTRMALVPYSMGVNMGDLVDESRGAARGPTNVQGVKWLAPAPLISLGVQGVSKANPGVITALLHGLQTGDGVYITGIKSKTTGTRLDTWLNNKTYRVTVIDLNSFSLQRWTGSSWVNVSTSGYSDYQSSGTIQKCIVSTCEIVVDSTAHGLSTGDQARISSVGGTTQINNVNAISGTNIYHTVTRLSADRIQLNGVPGLGTTNYTSGGTVQCLEYGCNSYQFVNVDGADRVFWATDCVTERTGSDAFKDTSPASARVSFHYTGTNDVGTGGCMTTGITPLTSDRTLLHSDINGFKAEGGTAGQIGTAWGWYMLSPNFSSLFPAGRRPQPFGTRNLLKVMILMTDGEFNAPYCNGVRARNAGVGGGTSDRKINCDATEGLPFAQTVKLCAAMKQQNVIIYTVGFDISSTSDSTPNVVDTAKEVMSTCATSPSHVYLPENGTSLKSAFGAIGRSISQLRISK